LPDGTKYILNVSNSAPHKGAEVALRGIAELKKSNAWSDWALVICGWGVDSFSQSCAQPLQGEYITRIRSLVQELGLIEGQDVFFFGYIDEAQLKGLFEDASIVLNAARFDNGSFSMVEGAWFDKPVICSRYPASEYVDRRFGIGCHFFEVNDHQGLAAAARRAREQMVADGYAIADRRHHVVRDEVRLRRFGERLYDALVQLAEGKAVVTTAATTITATTTANDYASLARAS
jgi:glycosyltransferase involved in cell wall biosynthesis